MQPPGLLHVQAAREDGRWEQAYAGSAEMVVPDDFLNELGRNASAKRFYATLDRRNMFSIYLRLQTAKSSDTRKKRIASIVLQLARGEAFHS